MAISRWLLLKMRSVSGKSCRESQNTHFLFSNVFSKNVPLMRYCRKMKCSQGWQTMWRLHVACLISKATRAQAYDRARSSTSTFTHTHTQVYVIVIAFPRQRWFCERASVLRHTHLPSLVMGSFAKCCIISAIEIWQWCVLQRRATGWNGEMFTNR